MKNHKISPFLSKKINSIVEINSMDEDAPEIIKYITPSPRKKSINSSPRKNSKSQ